VFSAVAVSLSPDVYERGTDDYEGVRALWAWVLLRAVEDKLSRSPRLRLDAQEAREWIESTDDSLQSFEWVCGVLELDSQATRAWALRATEEDVQKVRAAPMFGMLSALGRQESRARNGLHKRVATAGRICTVEHDAAR
jgi:hypothetical protein